MDRNISIRDTFVMNPDELQNNRNINVCMSDSPPKASFANSRKTPSNHEEDFGNFPLNMNDNSFSDLNSDDSSAWMHKIDVSNFKILANDVTNDEISEILNENSHPNDINLSDSSTKKTLSNNNMLSNAALGANILSHSNLNFDDSKYSTNFLRYNSEPCIKKPKLVRHNSNLNSDSSNLSPPPHYSQHHHCPFPPQVFTPPVLDQYLFDHFGMNHPPPLNANSYESILQPNQLLSPTVSSSTKVYAKPLYSYSCLIALALKNTSPNVNTRKSFAAPRRKD
uniref:Uncharacterized protein n=1 Tax=Romanomermis culicivorax TaxID=13658 RepID=A0A915IWN2_ROMCU